MRITDLFRNQEVDQTAVQKNQSAQQQSERATAAKVAANKAAGEDSISISPLARQLGTIQRVVSEDEQLQQQKIDDIKQRINAGTYNVSSNDLAGSLLAFAQDE